MKNNINILYGLIYNLIDSYWNKINDKINNVTSLSLSLPVYHLPTRHSNFNNHNDYHTI